jgi:hypothetical protein
MHPRPVIDGSFVTILADIVRELWDAAFEPYRPERHYMRGPGPKWRAKHTPAYGEVA